MNPQPIKNKPLKKSLAVKVETFKNEKYSSWIKNLKNPYVSNSGRGNLNSGLHIFKRTILYTYMKKILSNYCQTV